MRRETRKVVLEGVLNKWVGGSPWTVDSPSHVFGGDNPVVTVGGPEQNDLGDELLKFDGHHVRITIEDIEPEGTAGG
jgi:hypothetical protein